MRCIIKLLTTCWPILSPWVLSLSHSCPWALWVKSSKFIYWACCPRVWHIPLDISGQLSWLWSLTAPCAPVWWQSMGNWKILGSGWALLSDRRNISMLPTFSYWIPNSVLYRLVRRREWTLFQPNKGTWLNWVTHGAVAPYSYKSILCKLTITTTLN